MSSVSSPPHPPADSPEVLARINATMELVELIAGSMKRTLRRVELDDLRSAGREGLLTAARAYDPAKGVPFRAYASFRVRGAMLDHVRRASNLSRPGLDRLRAFERAQIIAEAQAEDAVAGVAASRGQSGPGAPTPMTPEQADALLSDRLAASAFAMALGFLTASGGEALEQIANPVESELVVERRLLLRQVEELMRARPVVEQQVLQMHYFEDLSLDEIGGRLGLHKSWVCRVLARTIESLARKLTPVESAGHGPAP